MKFRIFWTYASGHFEPRDELIDAPDKYAAYAELKRRHEGTASGDEIKIIKVETGR